MFTRGSEIVVTGSAVPIWGSARTHGVGDGVTFTFYGRGRSGPDRRGVRVRASRRDGQVTLRDAKTGDAILTGGAAVRFWARMPALRVPQDGRTASSPPPSTVRRSKTAQGASKASVGVGGSIPDHPGRVWLRRMRDAGLSQSETARRMGVAPVTLNRLVRGRGVPTARMTVAFARAVGLDERETWQQVCDYELALALAGASRRRTSGGRARSGNAAAARGGRSTPLL